MRTQQALAVRIGTAIREARETAGLSQRDLATRIGAWQSVLSRWESGGRLISTVNLLAIADELRVPVDQLLGRTPVAHDGKAFRGRETVRLGGEWAGVL